MASSIEAVTALLATRQVALLAAVRQVEVLESLDALELRPDAWAEAAEVMGPIRRVLRRS